MTTQLLVNVDLTLNEPRSLPSEVHLKRWINQAVGQIAEFDSDLDLEISVRYCNSDDMRSLNSEFRERDRATNVLSFPSGMPTLTADNGQSLRPLGDIVLCPDVVDREAADQSKATMDHYAHLVVHGVLHLCGYDHNDDSGAEAMESLEIQILSGLGVANPYSQNSQ